MTRGKLILIEGLDRTGKTTQCKLLAQRLKPNAELLKFPDRTTQIGKMINEYLSKSDFKMPDHAAHLLFSANRWEVVGTIKELLLGGTHVILDRYVYSGIAYSAAKGIENMDINWCLQPDMGLLKPDITIFLTNQDQKENESRDGFGSERYEVAEFQLKVKEKFFEVFRKLDNYPNDPTSGLEVLDVTNKSIEEGSQCVWDLIKNTLGRESAVEFSYF